MRNMNETPVQRDQRIIREARSTSVEFALAVGRQRARLWNARADAGTLFSDEEASVPAR